jgi:hypothetical protein
MILWTKRSETRLQDYTQHLEIIRQQVNDFARKYGKRSWKNRPALLTFAISLTDKLQTSRLEKLTKER